MALAIFIALVAVTTLIADNFIIVKPPSKQQEVGIIKSNVTAKTEYKSMNEQMNKTIPT